jgi:hypothetical protein
MSESSLISVKILNEKNPVTQEVDDFRFYAGEDRTLKCQLWHDGDDAAYIVAAGGTVESRFKTKSGFDLIKSATIDGVDRSIVTITLTSIDTIKLIDGDAQLEVTESSVKRIARQGKLSKGMVLLK